LKPRSFRLILRFEIGRCFGSVGVKPVETLFIYEIRILKMDLKKSTLLETFYDTSALTSGFSGEVSVSSDEELGGFLGEADLWVSFSPDSESFRGLSIAPFGAYGTYEADNPGLTIR
jgi:hypothetical protein